MITESDPESTTFSFVMITKRVALSLVKLIRRASTFRFYRSAALSLAMAAFVTSRLSITFFAATAVLLVDSVEN